MSKVVVGMSGGVDSAVAAYLLKKAGYDVVGLTLRTWEAEENKQSRCCEIDDASDSARKIGIEYHTLNCLSDFKSYVVEPFIDDYLNGYTPNPCVVCNRSVKWERMLYFAKVVKADFVATGHYANVIRMDNGRYSVSQASHIDKDQTYMLYRLSQEQLSKTLMPLGDKTKDEVRDIARRVGIAVADKPDSQEICFVSDGKYYEFIESNSDKNIPPAGNFVDIDGNILGQHKGITHYTVGQRKGLGIALGYPAFVKKINACTNEVVLCREEDIYSDEILVRDVNYVGLKPLQIGESNRCYVKVRYHHRAQKATIEAQGNGNIKVTFDEPVRAASPGQSAVFYDSSGVVLGGGVIENH